MVIHTSVEFRRTTADGEDEPLTFPEIEEEHCSARTPDGREYVMQSFSMSIMSSPEGSDQFVFIWEFPETEVYPKMDGL